MKRTLVPPDPPDMNLNTARVNELHIHSRSTQNLWSSRGVDVVGSYG